MADETDHEKQDIAELARTAADAVSKLAVEVVRMVMDGVRSAFETARASAEGETAESIDDGEKADDTGGDAPAD